MLLVVLLPIFGNTLFLKVLRVVMLAGTSSCMKDQVALQNAIRSRLENLRVRYPQYSVRAFAKKIGVSPATLSLILQGKRKISQKLATQLSEKLLFDPQERAEVLNSFFEKKKKTLNQVSSPEYVQLTVDQYRIVSDWKAFAILNLIKLKDFQNDSSWIAQRLGVSTQDITDTVERLKRLEMLEEINGELKRTNSKYRTSEDIENLSLRKSHQQTLDLAQNSLENDSVEQRDFTWVTFPMDTKKMNEAKTLIRKFQDDLYAMISDQSDPNEVYRLAIQLFPLTKINKKQGEPK